MFEKLLRRFDDIEKFSLAMNDVSESLELDKKPTIDDDLKNFLKDFLMEIYRSHTETINLINQISSYVSVNEYYKKITEKAEIMEKFLDKYKEIFIAAGITDEYEITKRKKIISDFSKLRP